MKASDPAALVGLLCIIIAVQMVSGCGLSCTRQPWGNSASCSGDVASEERGNGIERGRASSRRLMLSDSPSLSGSPQPADSSETTMTEGPDATAPSPAPQATEPFYENSSSNHTKELSSQPPAAFLSPIPQATEPSNKSHSSCSSCSDHTEEMLHPPASTRVAMAPFGSTAFRPTPAPGPAITNLERKHQSACGAGCAAGIVVATLVVAALAALAAVAKFRPGSLAFKQNLDWRSGLSTTASNNVAALQEGQRVFYHIPGQESNLGTLLHCIDGDNCYTVIKDGEQDSMRIVKAHVAPYYERGTPLIYTAYDGNESVCTVIKSSVSQWPPNYYVREETSGKEINTFARNLTLLQAYKPLISIPGAA